MEYAMSVVEYCDNINCSFNEKFSCSAEEVGFDEEALCLAARYEDSDEPEPDEEKTTEAPPPPSKKPAGNNDDSWIKYL